MRLLQHGLQNPGPVMPFKHYV